MNTRRSQEECAYLGKKVEHRVYDVSLLPASKLARAHIERENALMKTEFPSVLSSELACGWQKICPLILERFFVRYKGEEFEEKFLEIFRELCILPIQGTLLYFSNSIAQEIFYALFARNLSVSTDYPWLYIRICRQAS